MAPNDSTSYLDYNATTPVLPEAAQAVAASLSLFGNPSSVHAAGRRARAAVEEAREAVAAAMNAAAQHVVFTGSGTEANALALRGLAAANRCTAALSAGIEHPSVLAHVADEHIPVDAHGVIDLAALERALGSRAAPVLVTLMLANNETGVLQPVAQAVELARKYGALIHIDAVQALGKVPVDFRALGADSMSFSAHKIGGLKGVGALVLRPGVEIAADIPGGGQERRRRAGTEHVSGIAAFGAAARGVPTLLSAAPRITALRDELEMQIQSGVPQARIFGAAVARLGNTACIALPGVSSETQVMRLDLAGVAVSAGSACSSGKIAPSPVLLAMGVGESTAKTAIRVSLGWDTTAADVDRFLKVWLPLAANAAA
ncbi:MAG: cysteine desulfurase [Rhodospirillaceae bacterium]|nr:cysteine desulfurase [Rhodospirillaceae bacterium]